MLHATFAAAILYTNMGKEAPDTLNELK